MKKLMIAAAAVMVGVAVHAAPFTWGSGANYMAPNIDLANMTTGDFGPSGTQALKQMTGVTWAYTLLLDNGTLDDTVPINSITWGGAKPMSNLSSEVVYKPASGQPDNVVNYELQIVGTYTDGNGDVWTITANSTEQSPLTGTASFSELANLAILSNAPMSWTVTGGPSPVPEPTSGLLLLLGVAGLALRRKQK